MVPHTTDKCRAGNISDLALKDPRTPIEVILSAPFVIGSMQSTGQRCGRTTTIRVIDVEPRDILETKLVESYETYVKLRHALRKDPHSWDLRVAVLWEIQLQRYLHALLGGKGEPPGLLY